MKTCANLIIGAGIAGLGASLSLKTRGEDALILEKESTFGGLCGNFTIDGFRFDRFVHFSFARDERVQKIFSDACPRIYRHSPNAYNLYYGRWVKHPAQNNLYPLTREEKEAIVADFKKRPIDVDTASINNYDQWLRLQFGDYFAEHFPIPYTRKYWMREAKELETRWMGSREGTRLYQPSLDEVIYGCNNPETPVTYYSKEMRYPHKGGYKAFLTTLAEKADIAYNCKVIGIDAAKKTAICETPEGISNYCYRRLISSAPLPEVVKMLGDAVPEDVKDSAGRLATTSGYQVSIGLKSTNIPPYLWWYIYDEDILPARVYSPSLKSPDNAPEGCASLQMEIYCEKDKYTIEELKQKSVFRLIDQGIIKAEDILFTDVRFEPYANVIFDHEIYKSRDRVRKWLGEMGIETIGRFGEWDYLWSDQSLLSGLSVK